MPYQQNDNSGSLFLNDRKQTANQPDFTGKAIIDGKLKYVSMWLKTSKRDDGSIINYYSLAFKDAQAQPVQQAASPAFPAFPGQPQPVQQAAQPSAQIFPGHQPVAQPQPVYPQAPAPQYPHAPVSEPMFPETAPDDDLPFR